MCGFCGVTFSHQSAKNPAQPHHLGEAGALVGVLKEAQVRWQLCPENPPAHCG